MKKQNNNQIRAGLRFDKKLKKGFYYFLYEKNIDWAIILGVFFLILPYVASHTWYFLTIKITIVIIIGFLILKYLKTWNSLRQYRSVLAKWEKIKKERITKDIIKNTDLDSANETLKEIGNELKIIKNKFEKKSDQYKDFEEYTKYDKVDFIKIEEIINKNLKNDLNALLISFAFYIGILQLRTIPREEYNNYKRLLALIFLAIGYFIIYTIENSTKL